MSCYQSQAHVIALVKLIGSAILLVFLICITPFMFGWMEDEIEEDPFWRHKMRLFSCVSATKKLLVLIPTYFYLIGEIALAIYLHYAVGKRHYKKLRTWFIVTLTYVTIMTVIFGPFLIYAFNSIQPGISSLFFINFFITLYSLFIVYKFRGEIKANTLPQSFGQIYFGPNIENTFPPPYPFSEEAAGSSKGSKVKNQNDNDDAKEFTRD